MGLTIHYQLANAGNEAQSRKLVQWLRQAALDLPFEHVGELVEFRGDECDLKLRTQDDPHRWLLVQAANQMKLPLTSEQKRRGVTGSFMEAQPEHLIGFETWPGKGSEAANFGLCRYPEMVWVPGYGRIKTKLKGWSWASFCKTHYACDPRCGGLPNFLRCHLCVVALLDEAAKLKTLRNVCDEGDFWKTRSLDRLTREIGEQTGMLAGFVGALKDAIGPVSGGAGVVAPITAYPNFEQLEAEGRRLLPAQMKVVLKMLAQSNLLRDRARQRKRRKA